MDGEIAAPGKTLAALVAAEGFLARVRPPMDGESAALGKALAALVAAEGFLARVRPAMDGEMAAPGKTLAALVAAEGLLNGHMDQLAVLGGSYLAGLGLVHRFGCSLARGHGRGQDILTYFGLVRVVSCHGKCRLLV